MKIILLKEYLRKKKDKQKPLCPKCKIEMEFDINIGKESESAHGVIFRKGHDDAIFECEGCRQFYVVLDYIEEDLI